MPIGEQRYGSVFGPRPAESEIVESARGPIVEEGADRVQRPSFFGRAGTDALSPRAVGVTLVPGRDGLTAAVSSRPPARAYVIIFATSALLLACGIGATSAGATPTPTTPPKVAAIAAKVDPGLVDVDTELSYQTASGAGTGIVVTSSGEVFTNNHVIENETSLHVTDVGNHKTYTATVVATT
jgi:S1-C subfamily serine protease